jgi:hypothetical protein
MRILVSNTEIMEGSGLKPLLARIVGEKTGRMMEIMEEAFFGEPCGKQVKYK